MAAVKKYRYPGLNFYREEDKDIFFGRNEDSQRLYTQVILNQTLVLHAESGTGKSSVIQAGLLPLLKAGQPDYLSLTIRFDEPTAGVALIDNVIKKVKEGLPPLTGINLPYTNVTHEKLWVLAKKLAKTNKKLLIIFDQFEQLQGFDQKQITGFKTALAELLSTDIPAKIHKQIQEHTAPIIERDDLTAEEIAEFNDNTNFLKEPLNVKLIFVVREDKLGTMSFLSDVIPDILKNDLVLKHLNKESAKEAVLRPSQADGDFASPKFEFESIDIIESKLAEIADSDTGLIDPIQLQIVFSNIEKGIIANADNKKATSSKIIVTEREIPPIGDIINDFYNNTWQQVRDTITEKYGPLSDTEFDQHRLYVINELVVENSRDLVLTKKLSDPDSPNSIFKITTSVLLATGFMREIAGQDSFYQLCHDRFIAPVNADIARITAVEQILKETEKVAEEKVKAAKRRRLIFGWVALSILLIIGVLFIIITQKEKLEAEKQTEIAKNALKDSDRQRKEAYNQRQEAIKQKMIADSLTKIATINERSIRQNRILTILNTIRRDNPTLSYIIAQQTKEVFKNDEKIDAFINEYHKLNYGYLLGSFPILISDKYDGDFVDAGIIDKNHVSILTRHANSIWSIRTQMRLPAKRVSSGIPTYLKYIFLNGKQYAVYVSSNGVKIQDGNGRIVNQFKADASILKGPRNICISNNGEYILVDNRVYNYRNKSLVGFLPQAPDDAQLMDAAFFNDGKHLAIGYESGDKVIYQIDESKAERIKKVSTTPGLSITSIAFASNGRYMIAGEMDGGIEVWEINEHANTPYSYTSIAELAGHTGKVNDIAISPDGNFFLSGSNDYLAILWDIHTMKRLRILKGRESAVTYTSFSADGKTLMTGTRDGVLSLWSTESPAVLYKQNRLVHFSPFDYYTVGLGKNDEFSKYLLKPADITQLYKATMTYFLSMPVINLYEGDIGYLDDIRLSAKEINAMYHLLVGNKDYETTFSLEQRVLIENYDKIFNANMANLLH